VGTDADLQEIRSLGGRDLSVWLDAHPAAVASQQWWWSISESVEISASFVRNMPAEERRDRLNVGARLLVIGSERDEVPVPVVAYWQLRLAVGVIRARLEDPGLAETLTVAGAVRWALDNMPGSREEIVSYGRERAALYRAADDSFCARPASFDGLKPDAHTKVLQDAEMVLAALEWVDLSLLDEGLRGEAESWLEIRSDLRLDT
jgi:hypothetical protein